MELEHEAGKVSCLEMLESLKEEQRVMTHKFSHMDHKQLLEEDNAFALRAITLIEQEFESAWQARKDILAQHKKFFSFTIQLKVIMDEINDTKHVLTNLSFSGEDLDSVKSTGQSIRKIEKNLQELQKKLNTLKEEDISGPHATAINLGLSQINQKWQDLLEILRQQKQNLEQVEEHCKIMDRMEKSITVSQKSVISWSRIVVCVEDVTKLDNLEADIKRHSNQLKKEENEMLRQLPSKAEIIKNKYNEMYNAMESLVTQVSIQRTKLMEKETITFNPKVDSNLNSEVVAEQDNKIDNNSENTKKPKDDIISKKN